MAGALVAKLKSLIGFYPEEEQPFIGQQGYAYSVNNNQNTPYRSTENYEQENGGYPNDNTEDNITFNGNIRDQKERSGRLGGYGGGGGGNAGSKGSPNNVSYLPPRPQQTYTLVSAKPDHLDDAQMVCDHLKERHVVIVNVEGLDSREAQRIVDFIGGAVYALDGEILDITNRIFAVAPLNVDLVSIQRDTKSKGFFSYGNGAYAR